MTRNERTSDELLQERARARSAALIRPYEAALAHVESLSPDAPVVPQPSTDQRYIEGLVMGRLGRLLDPERAKRPSAHFVPLRIDAGVDHYTMKVRGDGVAGVLHSLLPVWEVGGDEIDGGIPGLRYSPSDDGTGVSFYLLGRSGVVTFRGPSLGEFECFRLTVLREAGQVSVRPDDPLTPQEDASPVRSLESVLAASIVARRLGLIVNAGSTAVDSWWNTHDRFAVELIVPDDAPNPMPELLAQMQSPHLAPRLRLDRWGSDHHYLSIDGSKAEIDLRVLWVPTP